MTKTARQWAGVADGGKASKEATHSQGDSYSENFISSTSTWFQVVPFGH